MLYVPVVTFSAHENVAVVAPGVYCVNVSSAHLTFEDMVSDETRGSSVPGNNEAVVYPEGIDGTVIVCAGIVMN